MLKNISHPSELCPRAVGLVAAILLLSGAAGSRAVSGADGPRGSGRVSVLSAPDGRAVPTVVRSGGARSEGGGGGVLPGISNGDFSAGLEGWRFSESGGEEAPGEVRVEDGGAVIAEGDSFLVTLEQTFTVVEGAGELSFALFLDPGFDESAEFIPDAFEVSLLDAANNPVIGSWDPRATSSFNLQEDGTSHMATGVRWDGSTVRLDVRSLAPGTELTLYFDLVGGDADTAGGVRVDDVAIESGPAPGAFIRGDHDGDGAVELADAAALLAALFAGAAGPVDCAGAANADAADANDNEWLTVADYQALRAAVTAGGSLPEPAAGCGPDPSDDARGFDRVDPLFRVSLGELELLTAPNDPEPRVSLPVLVDSPDPISAVTLILEYDPGPLAPYDPGSGDPTPVAATAPGAETAWRVEAGRLLISLWAGEPGGRLADGAPGTLQRVGTVFFHLERFQAVRPFRWIPELQVGGVRHRATIVDDAFDDHHPEALLRDQEFVRGNSNGDQRVDISDGISTLSFLFQGGEEPGCLDAADANNDSRVDISDAIYTFSFLFLGGEAIPPPYPECGIDVGPADLLGCGLDSCP